MLSGFDLQEINLKDTKKFAEVQAFLGKFDLSFDHDVEYTIVLRDDNDGKIVGTGSFSGEVLRNFAIDENIQGAGLASTIVTALMQEAARRGRYHYFIFTKPAKASLFAALGFKEIARAEPYVALLETGLGSIEAYCEGLKNEIAHLNETRAAVVVNCNPFTNGHRALIEQAASENLAVVVFVVSEDRSLFPFNDRLKLVRAGVVDLTNVVVVPAGSYIISSATFPTYFTRDADKIVAQTRLDISLFASQIALRLGIKSRYVGEEPYCEVTNAYNQAMLEILPYYGIEVNIIKRITAEHEIISASKVRDMIRTSNWDSIKKMVPQTTFDYLTSPAATGVIEKIRNSVSRH